MDYRREWIKDRVLQMTGLDSHQYFEDLMEANDGELDDQLLSFLDDDVHPTDSSANKFFYVYRVPYEKLAEEEIMAAEVGTLKLILYQYVALNYSSQMIVKSEQQFHTIFLVVVVPPEPESEPEPEVTARKKKGKGKGGAKKGGKKGKKTPSPPVSPVETSLVDGQELGKSPCSITSSIIQ